MFEQASRLKLRFSHKGNITTEDLWDLSDKDLDKIYSGLSEEKKQSEGESLINSREDKTLTLRLEIVKHIFEAKRDEAKAEKNKAIDKVRRQKILEILDKKNDDDLESKTVEQLEAMLVDG